MPIFDNALWPEVKRRIEADFGSQDIDRRLEWVKECLEKRDHMTVFRLDGSDSAKDIDLAILQALLKGMDLLSIFTYRSYHIYPIKCFDMTRECTSV